MEYNALIRQFSGKSLKLIARILVTDLHDIPANWKIRYSAKEVDRETTKIEDLCCCEKNPLQIYKPAQNTIPITVCTIDGKTFQVNVSPEDTIAVLKIKIFQIKDNLPPKIQRLYTAKNIWGLVPLFDWMTLDHCQITAGSTVYLKPTSCEILYNRVNFKPISWQETLSVDNHRQQGLNLAEYLAGLNITGMCVNPDCVSRNQNSVVRNVHFGEIRINFTHPQNNQLNIPSIAGTQKEGEICTHPIIPKSYHLRNARCVMYIRLFGQKRVWQGIFKANDSEAKAIEMNTGEIELLEVTTVERWRSPFACVRCDVNIMFKAHEVQMNCGHVYHEWCMPSALKGRKCKVCDAKILIVGKMSDIFQTV